MEAPLRPGGAFAGRQTRRRSRQPISDIDMTPLAGVMVVLLIIFMVAAPLLTVGVGIDADQALPEAEPGPAALEPIDITVDADGKVFLQGAEVPLDELTPKLALIREAGGTAQVFVRGDRNTPYGRVAAVLVRIKEAGLSVTLLTDQVE